MNLEHWGEAKTGPVHCIGRAIAPLSAVVEVIGKPHFIEADPLATASGREMLWAFRGQNGQAICFLFSEPTSILAIGTTDDTADSEEILQQFSPLQFDQTSGLLWD